VKTHPSIRTTMKDVFDTECEGLDGVYIFAYMGKVVYIGKAENVGQRIKTHVYNVQHSSELLGKWLVKNADHDNIRIDILESPKDSGDYWRADVESKLIRKLRPLLNVAMNH